MKIIKNIKNLFLPKSPLKQEIYYLKIKIYKTQKKIDKVYSEEVVCCHHCAYVWLRDLEEKQKRRIKRLRQLENKLDRSK